MQPKNVEEKPSRPPVEGTSVMYSLPWKADKLGVDISEYRLLCQECAINKLNAEIKKLKKKIKKLER